MLRIATPGVPLSTPKPGGTLTGIAHAHALGIRAMEMEWVQSVPKNPEHVAHIRAAAEPLDFALTVHAPFFVNLHASDPAKLAASKKRILDALSMAQVAGAMSVCVHAAFYQGSDSRTVTDSVRRATEELLSHKDVLFPDVNLAYETMGKHSQWGTLEEVLAVSKEYGLYPCVDAAHLHARGNGAVNTAAEWHAMLDDYAAALGADALKRMHLHYSGIAYGDKGERHHLPLQESDAAWEDYLQVLIDRGVGGALVCESPLLEEDTLLLSHAYDRFRSP